MTVGNYFIFIILFKDSEYESINASSCKGSDNDYPKDPHGKPSINSPKEMINYYKQEMNRLKNEESGKVNTNNLKSKEISEEIKKKLENRKININITLNNKVMSLDLCFSNNFNQEEIENFAHEHKLTEEIALLIYRKYRLAIQQVDDFYNSLKAKDEKYIDLCSKLMQNIEERKIDKSF